MHLLGYIWTIKTRSHSTLSLLLLLLFELRGSFAETEIETPNEEEFYKRFQQEPLFTQEKICQEKCGEREHTACKTIEIPECDKFEIYRIYRVEFLKKIDLKNMILTGHNGLRHRIAQKMGVADMVKVSWDDSLADMTVAFFMQCDPFVDDPCTQNVFPEKIGGLDYYEKDLSKWIVQNRYRIDSEYYPSNFIEAALGAWYFGKDLLEEPNYLYIDTILANITILKGENNFTHLASPLIFHIGCSFARIDKSFTLVCNYYPFYRKPNNKTVFIKGKPASICPTYFPLHDNYFSGLCTDDLYLNAAQLIIYDRLCLLATVLTAIWRFPSKFFSHAVN